MENYGLVSSDPSWTWIVKKQCFVCWTDNEEGPKHLGEVSPRNCTTRITLNIGRCPESNELLIALHLPILERGKKTARDMFMIIPNTFDTSNLDTTFAPVQTAGRAELDNAGFAYCNLFHIPVTVAEPCIVVMPQRKRQQPMEGTAQFLVSKLKSLSESSSFDIYIRFDTFAQVELRKIFITLDQTNMPSLLLDSMYDGRGGRVNDWQHQGLNLEPKGSRHPPHPEASQRDLAQPPPYTRHNISPPRSNGTQPLEVRAAEPSPDVQVPCSDAVVNPVWGKANSDNEEVPETPFWARMQRILDYRSPSANYRPRDRCKRAASADSLPDARHGKHIRACRSPLLELPTRKNFDPVGPEKVAAAASHGVDSPTSPSIDKPESSWRPFEATPASLPVDWDAGKTISVHHDTNPPFDKAEEIARWLHSAWTVLPDVHHVLRLQLLALGAARDAESFADIRADCSTELAFTAARVPNLPSIAEMQDPVKQVRELVKWINSARPDADIALIHELVALARAAIDVADCVHQEKRDRLERFSVLKARCIAAACVL